MTGWFCQLTVLKKLCLLKIQLFNCTNITNQLLAYNYCAFFPQKPETTYDTTILYNGVKSGVSLLFITRGRAKNVNQKMLFHEC